jgi:hypothetical protein
MLTLVHFICEPLDRTTLNTRGSRALGIDTRAVAAEVTRVPQPLRFGERRAGANLPEHVLLHLHQMRPLVALGHVLLLAPLRHVPLGAATPRPPPVASRAGHGNRNQLSQGSSPSLNSQES